MHISERVTHLAPGLVDDRMLLTCLLVNESVGDAEVNLQRRGDHILAESSATTRDDHGAGKFKRRRQDYGLVFRCWRRPFDGQIPLAPNCDKLRCSG